MTPFIWKSWFLDITRYQYTHIHKFPVSLDKESLPILTCGARFSVSLTSFVSGRVAKCRLEMASLSWLGAGSTVDWVLIPPHSFLCLLYPPTLFSKELVEPRRSARPVRASSWVGVSWGRRRRFTWLPPCPGSMTKQHRPEGYCSISWF